MDNGGLDTAPSPLFTIFTPTYNRADTLTRLFLSIKAQTRRDFEWLVVDDGSSDDTSLLMQQLSQEANFPLRYVKQQNSGKHIAFNHGVEEARGELFLTIDSDDELTPDALAVLEDAWLSIPAEQRDGFTGVTARCVDGRGRLVGEPGVQPILDSDSADATLVRKLMGERIGFHRTDILRSHPFPDTLPARFIPEGRIWLDIARRYRTRFIEAPARIFHDHDAPRLSNLDRAQRAWGDFEYNRFALQHYANWWRRAPIAVAKFAIGLRRAELHLGMVADRKGFSGLGRLWIACALPAAIVTYARDLRSQDAAFGRRLLLARLILGGRCGSRLAAILGRRSRRHPLPPAITVHANGVMAVVDPRDPGNDALLFSPRTFKTGLPGTLRMATANVSKLVLIGSNVTYAALQAARAAPSSTDITTIEPGSAQAARTRMSARASYADKILALETMPDIIADHVSIGDAIYFDWIDSARDWLRSSADRQRPARIIVEVEAGQLKRAKDLAFELLSANYTEAGYSTSALMVFEHEQEAAGNADSA